MRYQEFCEEYTKLHKFFYPTTEPNVSRMEECYGLLKMLPLAKFQRACQQIKQDEDSIPRNIVSYVNRRVDYHDEHRATGGSRPQGLSFCAACQNTGFITCSMRTGGPIRFPIPENPPAIAAKYGLYDNTFIKTCLCPRGQRMAQGSGTKEATQDECRQAAILNGGSQKQVYVNERKAEGLIDMDKLDIPPAFTQDDYNFPDNPPF